jgi:hypothetical protein
MCARALECRAILFPKAILQAEFEANRAALATKGRYNRRRAAKRTADAGS